MRRVSERGFTLLEMLIVISIIGVLTVVVMVNFQHGNRINDLRRASIELAQRIRLAQGYTTGGSSINYCAAGSTANEYALCTDDNDCGGAVGFCTNGVPPGGYGVSIVSAYGYQLLANTNTVNYYLDAKDPIIINQDNTIKGIKVSGFKIGSNTYLPDTNTLDIIFTPPDGAISFYVNSALVGDTIVDILIASDFLTNVCRKITVNRVSSQISESQSNCTL